MANLKGGYALIDFGGQAVSTTPITIPGAYALVKSGKPVIFQNITFDALLPGTSVFVSQSTWQDGDPDSDYVAVFGDTYIGITKDDAIAIQE